MKKTRRFTSFLSALILTFSFVTAICAVPASALKRQKSQATEKYTLPKTTEKLNSFAKAYEFKVKGKASYGYDWTYKINNKNIKVNCKYDFKLHRYTFKVTGKSYGLTKLTIKYKKNNVWEKVPMKIFVDPKKYIMRTK